MLINSITLKNFRSYEDEFTFLFAPNKERNIVLVGGENGAGKSTLFDAMKLAIYGPMAYGYTGENSVYLSKIKNSINVNAFKNKAVESFINVVIEIKEGVELNNYSLTRKWKIESKRLCEEFIVLKNKNKLNKEETIYFNNYFKSILPPSLFDFFFFDGEELSEFFTGKNANNNLKEAVLQLFNYDTFNVLKKQLINYQRNNLISNEKLALIQEEFDEKSSLVNEIKEKLSSLNKEIEEQNLLKENLLIELNKLEENFKNSGGLLEEEKNYINSQIKKLEDERLESTQNIKDFCNDSLPFLIIPDLIKKTKKQINDEDILTSFNNLKSTLDANIVKNSIIEEISISSNDDSKFENIANNIINNIFKDTDISTIDTILSLSSNQKNNVLSIINNILENNSKIKTNIENKFSRTKEISTELKDLRNKINLSVSEETLVEYLNKKNKLKEAISTCENKINLCNLSIEQDTINLSSAEYALVRAKNQYTNAMQSSNTLELSNNIVNLLNAIVEELTKDKIKSIENNFLFIFKEIIRKDNYINNISIDDNFNYTLYIDKDYSSIDILNMINNINFDELSKKYGSKFISDLFEYYKVNDRKELLNKLNANPTLELITLSTKVDVNGFSKGEKQIYILCLIWALIKTANVDIPFIIDTPYARIDETHRASLTNNYLPNISKQVIILSTNEEIDANLYEVIKPHICNEYLLLYNDKERKTEVKKGYFRV